MSLTSKTGLIAGRKKTIRRQVQIINIEFPDVVRPAPYTLKPFAGVYNPFPYGCSILCNHPADTEAKDVVKRAKDSWVTDGKPLVMTEELAAIRAGLLQGAHPYDDCDDSVPEELFRRYTDTDSRPLTPAPTLASVMTRGSGRRCVTPDPIPTHGLNPTRERTHLVLDLRRSHSQDTLCWHGTTVQNEFSAQVKGSSSASRTPSVHVTPKKKKPLPVKKKGLPVIQSVRSDGEIDKTQKLQLPVTQSTKNPVTAEALSQQTDSTAATDEEVLRRRGKKRRRSKKGEHEKEFQSLPEPGETQMSALNDDSCNTSARPSLTPATEVIPEYFTTSKPAEIKPKEKKHSFIDDNILKQLQRELDQEIIDSEFDRKRHIALEEALKSKPKGKRPPVSDEMKKIKKELKRSSTSDEHWLNVPRMFSRQNARFELPIDCRDLNSISPIQYVQKYVSISSVNKLLYNRVFNRHREELDDEDVDRLISGKKVGGALNEVMGTSMTPEQAQYFRDLMGWQDEEKLDFRTWCGICALCERLIGVQYTSQMAPKTTDPCHEVEKADFHTLPQKLRGMNPDPRMITILNGIRDL